MASSIGEMVRLVAKEASLHRRFVVGTFIVIIAFATVVGLTWRNTYTSSATVFVEKDSILGPLMHGTAYQSGVMDRARVARELIYGRKIMSQVIQGPRWPKSDDPALRERLMNYVRAHTLITNVGGNLVRIEYEDHDPVRAYQSTQKMAELFVSESLAAKARESQSAFQFIDRQAKEYQAKLSVAQDRLKQFRDKNADLQGMTPDQLRQEVATLEKNIVTYRQQLGDAEARRASLARQLRGEASVIATGSSGSDALTTQLMQLRQQLSTLRRSYLDSYPDVVEVKAQIADLEQQIKQGGGTAGAVAATTANPVREQMRRDYYQARTDIDTLKARIAETEQRLKDARERVDRAQKVETQLADLQRDYDVTAGLYKDLLQRRESARVSRDLTRQEEGNSLRVAEPAFLPYQSDGPDLLVFVAGGLLLGLVVPFGTLYVRHEIDPKVRLRSDLAERLGLPLLATVPHLATPSESRTLTRSYVFSSVAVLSTVGISAVLVVLRLQGVM